MVGLLPLAAATVIGPDVTARFPQLLDGALEFIDRHPSVASVLSRGRFRGDRGHHMLALFDEPRLRRILARLLDDEEFLSPYGIRSLSRHHASHPFELQVDGHRYEVPYLPAESDSGMFGGNSNWRGPVWFPMNALIIRALLNLYVCYGDEFTVECPTGSGVTMTLFEVAREISDRLTGIFLPDADGHRPCYGGQRIFAEDEHWRDLLTFSEYFHGDNGAGLGASHQTGWTGLVAVFPTLFASTHQPGPAGARTAANQRIALRKGGTMTGWPSAPVVYEVDTLAVADRPAAAPGGLGNARRRARRGVGRARAAGVGRRVADGGVGTEPRRPRDRPGGRGAPAGLPCRAAGPGT